MTASNRPRIVKPRPRPASEQVPLEGAAALIRDSIAGRRQELEARAPAAVDLAASVLAELHRGLRGRIADLAADRSARYRRTQLAGERALPFEDFAYLVLREPETTAEALEVLAAAVGCSLVPAEAEARELHHENAEFIRSASDFEATLSEGLADGVIDSEEREILLRFLRRIIARTIALGAAVRGNPRP